MKKKILLFVCLSIFSCSLSFSQSVILDFKERIFVEQINKMFIMEWFHHKVEVNVDTLKFNNDSLYSGKTHALIILDKGLYLKSKNSNKMLQLKNSTTKAIKNRKVRKDYNTQISK